MNGYDENLDVVLMEGLVDNGDGSGLEIKKMSYNQGEPKIALSRFYTNKEGQKKYVKLGRIRVEEFKKIAEILKQFEEVI